MIDLSNCRNPAAEHLGLSVQVSASLCQSAGIGGAYAGLQGSVTAVEDAECLIHLDTGSLASLRAIESQAFSEPFRDLGGEQWFCSGVLEVAQS